MSDDKESKASEMMRKLLTVGVGTLFLTEESIRTLFKEFKLPKELLGGILESANKTKREFLERLSQDVLSKVTENLDPVAVAEEFLARNHLDLTVRVSIKPKAGDRAKGTGSGETPDSSQND